MDRLLLWRGLSGAHLRRESCPHRKGGGGHPENQGTGKSAGPERCRDRGAAQANRADVHPIHRRKGAASEGTHLPAGGPLGIQDPQNLHRRGPQTDGLEVHRPRR